MRRPKSPQMTVVPFVEPPVATRGRPLAIFFLRSRLGSSHVPHVGDVVEKDRTFCSCRAASRGDECRNTGARLCLNDTDVQSLRPWKALSKVDELTAVIVCFAIRPLDEGSFGMPCASCLVSGGRGELQKIFPPSALRRAWGPGDGELSLDHTSSGGRKSKAQLNGASRMGPTWGGAGTASQPHFAQRCSAGHELRVSFACSGGSQLHPPVGGARHSHRRQTTRQFISWLASGLDIQDIY